MKKLIFMNNRYENFLKKINDVIFFSFKMNTDNIDFNNKTINCYGFVSHLFPFMKNIPYKNICKYSTSKLKLEEIETPIDYSFIFIKTNGCKFFNHIAIFVNHKVFEFTNSGYRSISFNQFLKENKKESYGFYVAIDSNNLILNNSIDFV